MLSINYSRISNSLSANKEKSIRVMNASRAFSKIDSSSVFPTISYEREIMIRSFSFFESFYLNSGLNKALSAFIFVSFSLIRDLFLKVNYF